MTDTCLVTGASGFIGRHLCQQLQQDGIKVRAMLRTPAEGPWDEVCTCDLASGAIPAGALTGVDSCYHLAGVVHATPLSGVPDSLYHTVNVIGSEQLANAAVSAGVRAFVYFSSVKAVADPGENCIDESWQDMPTDPYGLSKRIAEERLLETGEVSGMQVTVLRPALVYGAGVKGNLLRMLQAIDKGRFPPVPFSENRRSMVGVDDLVAAALCAARLAQASGQVYLVSDNAPCSTRALYDWMSEALGRPVHSWSVPGPLLQAGAWIGDLLESVTGHVPPLTTAALSRLRGSACYRSGMLQQSLGWRPQTTIREAMPAIVKCYLAEKTRPVTTV
jgi:nucleoside-diphosphate-sugar epimerase